MKRTPKQNCRVGLKDNGSEDIVELSQELATSIDKDRDGVISFHELLNVYFPLASDLDIQMMVDVVNTQLDHKEAAKKNRHLSMDNRREIVEIFKLWANGDSTLSQEDLMEALANSPLSNDDIEAIFRHCDVDDDKKISLDEFVHAMSSYYLHH